MQFQDNVPIYVQIANDLKEQMISGKLCENEKLRSVRELSGYYAVTALTVQRAMSLLEQEQIVQTRKGVGSFVVDGACNRLKKTMVHAYVVEFVQRMKNMGILEKEILTLVEEVLKNA